MSIIVDSLKSIPSNTKLKGHKFLHKSFQLFLPHFINLTRYDGKIKFPVTLLTYTWNAFLTFAPCPGVLMYGFLICHFNLIVIIQDLKYEENSVKAVQCLNDMVTNALMHAEDSLIYMSALRDSSIFRFCAIPQVLFFYLVTSDGTVI